MSLDFSYDKEYNSHIKRAREIRAKYPEIRKLMGANPATALWSIALVFSQWVASFAVSDLSWIWVFVLAYLFGAFLSHALYVIMHECAHNLVFRNPTYSKVMGIIGDFGLLFPGAMAFRKYHLMHHQHLGVYEKDPDIVSRTEGNIVGNSAIRKAIWVSVLGVSQALRPLKVTGAESSDRWLLVNIVAVVIVDIVIFVFFGPKALVYLGLSTLFALGLHPVGGRWIQEHHTDGDGQETHSYYGPLNKLSFNIGYHNEHHDFASIPWNNLPKLKKLAPDYYDTLNSYKSWTKVLFRFIFDKSMSTFSRIVHEPPGQNGGSKHAQTSEPRSDDSSIGDQR